MNLLDKFYSSFMQEIVSRQLANEDGETQEQAFTRYVLDLLSEAGETENAAVAFDEKALGTSKQHKINGFAISDNYETIDLFISIYEVEEQVYTVQKSEVTRAATRITNFFRKAVRYFWNLREKANPEIKLKSFLNEEVLEKSEYEIQSFLYKE